MKRSFALIMLLLLAAAAVPAFGQDSSGAATAVPQTPQRVEIAEHALQAPALSAQKTAGPRGLDVSLQRLEGQARLAPAGTTGVAEAHDLRLEKGRVQTQVVYSDRAAAEQAIRDAGGQITTVSEFEPVLQSWLHPDSLRALAADPAIDTIQRPHTAEPVDITVAAVESQGVVPMNAGAWHAAGIKGAGVKVAIIDVGFIGYAALLGSELPASVTLKNFVDGQSDAQAAQGNIHGTGVAEIVHDVAPEAQLYLIKINTDLDLEQAVNYAISQGVDIISTSLIWYNATPGDGTGRFADIVKNAHNNGILWSTAAGNDRERHWGGAFSDTDDDKVHEFNGPQEINYFLYELPASTSVRIYLRWNDWSVVNQDLDLYLMRYNVTEAKWESVAASTSNQNGGSGQKPLEAISYTTSGDSAAYGILVFGYSLTHGVDFDVFASRSPAFDEQVTLRSLGNLADAPDAITCAAVDWSAPFAQKYYSAEGPTNGTGGSAGPSGAYNKPEITAYAYVANATYGLFGGTSAAAPHVAGAAALVLDANPGYSAAELRSYLLNNALNLGPAGYDPLFGNGRVYLPYQAPTATHTPTATATKTATATATKTPTATATKTATATATKTPTATATATQTLTAAPTMTATATDVATLGPSPTATDTATPGPSPTATLTLNVPAGYSVYISLVTGYPGPD